MIMSMYVAWCFGTSSCLFKVSGPNSGKEGNILTKFLNAEDSYGEL